MLRWRGRLAGGGLRELGTPVWRPVKRGQLLLRPLRNQGWYLEQGLPRSCEEQVRGQGWCGAQMPGEPTLWSPSRADMSPGR